MLLGQGVTTAAMSGTVSDQDGAPLPEANVVAVHVPSSTAYRAVARAGGAYNIPNESRRPVSGHRQPHRLQGPHRRESVPQSGAGSQGRFPPSGPGDPV